MLLKAKVRYDSIADVGATSSYMLPSAMERWIEENPREDLSGNKEDRGNGRNYVTKFAHLDF